MSSPRLPLKFSVNLLSHHQFHFLFYFVLLTSPLVSGVHFLPLCVSRSYDRLPRPNVFHRVQSSPTSCILSLCAALCCCQSVLVSMQEFQRSSSVVSPVAFDPARVFDLIFCLALSMILFASPDGLPVYAPNPELEDIVMFYSVVYSPYAYLSPTQHEL